MRDDYILSRKQRGYTVDILVDSITNRIFQFHELQVGVPDVDWLANNFADLNQIA
jgi:hypothetical protein